MKNYTLKEYADLLSSVDMLAETEMMGRDETVITYLTYDSRAVTPGTLFIAKVQPLKNSIWRMRSGQVLWLMFLKYNMKQRPRCRV